VAQGIDLLTRLVAHLDAVRPTIANPLSQTSAAGLGIEASCVLALEIIPDRSSQDLAGPHVELGALR
jgi:hypothetical protein